MIMRDRDTKKRPVNPLAAGYQNSGRAQCIVTDTKIAVVLSVFVQIPK